MKSESFRDRNKPNMAVKRRISESNATDCLEQSGTEKKWCTEELYLEGCFKALKEDLPNASGCISCEKSHLIMLTIQRLANELVVNFPSEFRWLELRYNFGQSGRARPWYGMMVRTPNDPSPEWTYEDDFCGSICGYPSSQYLDLKARVDTQDDAAFRAIAEPHIRYIQSLLPAVGEYQFTLQNKSNSMEVD